MKIQKQSKLQLRKFVDKKFGVKLIFLSLNFKTKLSKKKTNLHTNPSPKIDYMDLE